MKAISETLKLFIILLAISLSFFGVIALITGTNQSTGSEIEL